MKDFKGTSLIYKVNNMNAYMILLVLMSMFLNQTNVVFGFNFSLSDIFAILFIFLIIFKDRLLFPTLPTIFALVLSIVVLYTSVYFVPNKFSFTPSESNVINNYVKLLAVFAYFIIGYNVAKHRNIDKIIKWFSIGALLISLIAILNLFGVSILKETFYFSNIRLKGLMNDPNYFSLLQICALAYFWEIKKVNKILQYCILVIIIISVLLSGSKTGLVTLLLYITLRFARYFINSVKGHKTIVKFILFLVTIILVIKTLVNNIEVILINLQNIIPGFNRISIIFIDPNEAISGAGSGRNNTWNVAFELIKLSPLLGIGIGTYVGIGMLHFNYGAIAHNTYLQLAVEWGLPLSLLFFLYIFIILIKDVYFNDEKNENNIILRDILVILLIGSLGISLNNARIFWIILGALHFKLYVSNK